MIPYRVYLSYVKADEPWAIRFSSVMAPVGIAVCNPPSEPTAQEQGASALHQAILAASHTLVLVGPSTRQSQWVDREIELSTEMRGASPGAGLIGVILPTHADFSQPYYDPENVPVRLHDLVQSEYAAMMKKWTEDAQKITGWLEDAERRRKFHRPEPSLRAVAEIYRFSWDKQVDQSRPDLEPL